MGWILLISVNGDNTEITVLVDVNIVVVIWNSAVIEIEDLMAVDR